MAMPPREFGRISVPRAVAATVWFRFAAAAARDAARRLPEDIDCTRTFQIIARGVFGIGPYALTIFTETRRYCHKGAGITSRN